MKKTSRKFKKLRAVQQKARLGRYMMGASLLVLGAQAKAGDALTPQQQAFEGGTNTYNNWIELTAGGMMTSGNKNQAAQNQNLYPGAFGGIQDLHYQADVAKKTTLTLDGHSIFDQHNYSVGLGLNRDDFGYVHLLVENFRTWDAGIGGFLPADGKTYALPGNALWLDRSRISLEAGLTKPNLPKITFKYNHRSWDGNESSTTWGPVHDSSGTARAYPGILDLNETSDTFQLDLTHHYKKVNYGVGVSYEHGDLNDASKLTFWNGESIQQKATDSQNTTYDLLSGHAFAETWLKKNLFLSTGFMYANLDDTFAGNRIYGDDFDVAYSPAYQALANGYTGLNGGAHQNEYVANINLLSQVTKFFTITPSLRVQQEDWNANSSGVGTAYDLFNDQGHAQSFNSNSGRDSLDVRERLDLRYTGQTNWVFNAGGEWTEGQGNFSEYGGLTQVGGIGPVPVQFASDDSRLFQKYYASARWYPVSKASLDVGGYYKINTYNYNNTQDNTPNDLSTGNAYPGFLLYQGFETLDGNLRLTLRPFNKLSLVSRYEYQYSTIDTRPDPISGLGQVQASVMNSQIIGQNVSWTPLSWLGLQAGINYVVSTTETPASAVTQSILNAQNNYWMVNFNSDVVLDDRTDLDLGYYYYHADDFQNPVNGLALGAGAEEHSATATLTRRISKNLRASLKFAFTHYEDSSTGGYGNYDALIVSSSLQYRF